ncbi:hypothetical protein [Streptomyces sp. NBC_00648]|uniref:hypothetical protein n=1 Tax=Streptomyces sp. NBC_00648 TaxID=2975797 RepID=UPI00324A01C2
MARPLFQPGKITRRAHLGHDDPVPRERHTQGGRPKTFTRETALELSAGDGDEPPEPLPPGYREVLAAFEQTRRGLRAKEVCEMLGIATEPRHTESIRAKLKRPVDRDILSEPAPAPSLFSLLRVLSQAVDDRP